MSQQSVPPSWPDRANGPADQESLAALLSSDPTTMAGPELLDAIVSAEKALSLLTGLQHRLTVAFAQPFTAGDPMKLAARLAKKSCTTGDDDPQQVQRYVTAAAASLAAAEIAAALRISPVTAGIRVRDADIMTSTLQPTLLALEGGVIDRGKAHVIAEHTRPLTPDHIAAVQHLVLPHAGAATTSELRDLAADAVLTVDPDGALERHHHAAARRELSLRPQPDAMATLNAYLPADGAVKIFQISDLLATTTAANPDDPRGIGARRVDALIDIADHLLTHGHLDLGDYLDRPLPEHGSPPPRSRTSNRTGSPATEPTTDATDARLGDQPPDNQQSADSQPAATEPGTHDESATAGEPDRTVGTATRRRRAMTRQGRRPHLSVIINHSTLAEHDNLPGYLNGYGAIPADLARAIATSAATITTQLTDPATGITTHAGALTYRPTQALRDQISTLLTTCQFPSCRQPAWRCEIDHREPFNHQHPEHGGRTDPDNTGPLCKRHHLYKHHTQWQLRPDPTGFITHWTSPTGHRYSRNPRPALAPNLDITTAGTAVAEKLDHLRDFAEATTARTRWGASSRTETTDPPTPPDAGSSHLEELLTALLIRHHVNQPRYNYEHPEIAWDDTAHDDPPPF